MAAPSAFSHSLPSVWSKCQCVLIRCLIGSRLRLLAASKIRERETVIPASMNTLPSAPVKTAILPPEPSRALQGADVTPQLVDLDWCLSGIIADQIYNVSCLGVGSRRAKPATCGRKRGSPHAAE